MTKRTTEHAVKSSPFVVNSDNDLTLESNITNVSPAGRQRNTVIIKSLPFQLFSRNIAHHHRLTSLDLYLVSEQHGRGYSDL